MSMTVASVILSQISSGVLMRIGARNFREDDKALEFNVSGSHRRFIRIELMPSDLYYIKCVRLADGLVYKTEFAVDMIYADQLDEVLLDIESSVWG